MAATVILNESNNWYHEFTNLPLYADAALTIPVTYSVTEEKVANYATTYEDVSATYTKVVNTHIPEEIEVSVIKVWNDDNDYDGIRPDSIQVQLYANGTANGASVVLEEANVWTYTWTELPKKEDGIDIIYTVEEVEVPKHYTMTIEKASNNNEFTITNSHTPDYDIEYKHFTITKKWLDNNDAKGLRPDSITVRAYQNGVFVTDIILDEDNNWTATAIWMSSRDGKEYTWTIEEVAVPNGYVASYDQESLTVTNSLRGLPQTGDASNIGLFVTTGVMALAGLTVLGKKRKKEDENE